MATASCPPEIFQAATTTSAFDFVFTKDVNRRVQSTKRTNSLGRSSSDCHSCQSSKVLCGRQRPRCDTCTNAGIRCPGYAQSLKWQNGATNRDRLSSMPLPLSLEPKQRSQDFAPKCFIFRQESGVKRRKALVAQPTNHHNVQLPNHEQPQRKRKEVLQTQSPKSACSSDDQTTLDEDADTAILGAGQSARALTLCPPMDSPLGLASHFSNALQFFQLRFSASTVTYAVRANPWQACLPQSLGNPSLLALIVALGKRYRSQLDDVPEGVEVLELKDKALSLFRSPTRNETNSEVLIGTILALIGLDYVASGYSNWSVHLTGALNIIESTGGIEIARVNPGLQSQLAMLVWYDMTRALISLKPPIFPRRYTESLLSWSSHDDWTLLALNGCPDVLCLHIYDIASLASRQYSVDEVINHEQLLWIAQFDTQDHHVAGMLDCWRLGLLLYCKQVFKTPASSPFASQPRPHRRVSRAESLFGTSGGSPVTGDSLLDSEYSLRKCRRSLAFEIFRLLACLPPASHTQKQCLIPVIIAACELDSTPECLTFRAKARDYCRSWEKRVGLRIYTTAINLMQTIWDLIDIGLNMETVWWGGVVKAAHNSQFNDSTSEDTAPGMDWLFG